MKPQKIASITFDPSYFQTTVRRESRYPLAWRWVKETLQNAVDAKSTEITYTFNKADKTFEVVDDGVGMTADVILNNFLAIGGSKKAGTSVGGFGDAKKVICFCWEAWELESGKCYLDSEMLNSEPIRQKKVGRIGTRIKAKLGDYFDVDSAVSYINLCELNVKVNAVVVEEDGTRSTIKTCKFATGKPLESIEFGDLYTAKFTARGHDRLGACVVRINGLAMFMKSVSGLKHDLCLELRGLTNPKTDGYILNVQREGLSWHEEMFLDKLLDMYRSEPHKITADKSDKDNIIDVQNGFGNCGSMQNMMYGPKPLVLLDVESVASGIDSGVVDSDSAAMVGIAIEQTPTAGDAPDRSGVFADIYPYDFVIKGKTNLRYGGLKYRRFCLLWHKMIQYVLFWNNYEGHALDVGDYKIGFTFPSEENVKAEYTVVDDSPCFLLNPDININSMSWRGVTLEVMDRAVHEITHRFYQFHDGSFMELYNKIKSYCYMNIDDFFNIGSAILKANKDDLVNAAALDENYHQNDNEDDE